MLGEQPANTDGLMTLTVTFRLGTDPDKAQQLVEIAAQVEARPKRCAVSVSRRSRARPI